MKENTMATFHPKQRIHIDTDNPQWGRVASDATVLRVGRIALFVEVDSIRAMIYVPKEDASAK
jgi:hypothetical protein